MKHYKDPETNMIYAYESDGSQDLIIPENYIFVDDAELASIRENERQSAFNNLSYVEKRISEYPDFRDYLDGIVKGDDAQVQAYISACMAVKAKYPKTT